MEMEYLQEPKAEDWIHIAEKFETRWNFPNCCGSIDGKHIRIKAPSNSGSVFYNYKSFFSIVLLAIATADYKFALVDIGSPGSMSDGGILRRSAIGAKMENGELDLPQTRHSASGALIPPVFIGDDAFPLKPYLLKPYAGRSTNELQLPDQIFNYRLSRARMVVENTFGIFSARWRIFEVPIDADHDTVMLITKTCVILHNFLTQRGDLNGITADREENGTLIPGSWRAVVANDIGMANIPHQGSNNAAQEAFKIRSNFRDYFMSPEDASKKKILCLDTSDLTSSLPPGMPLAHSPKSSASTLEYSTPSEKRKAEAISPNHSLQYPTILHKIHRQDTQAHMESTTDFDRLAALILSTKSEILTATKTEIKAIESNLATLIDVK
ncbi:unnamed protein product, partial [Allacma fusca]